MAHVLASPARLGHLQTGQLKLELDGSRIAANAGAIALNAVVLLLLLVPVAVPPSSPQAERDPEIVWVRPAIEPTPIEVPVVTRPRVQKPATAPQPRTASPQIDRPVVDSEPDDIMVPPVDPVARADAVDTPDLKPRLAASSQLQPISAPPPSYPIDAVRNGLTGIVELEILVGVDGKPLEARVVRSSGHRVLDQAARKVVLSQWRFQPAVRDGREVQALGRVPIVFKLER